MFTTERISESIGIVGVIHPVTIDNTTASSTWVDASKQERLLFILQSGALTDNKLDMKIQASDVVAGSNPVDVTDAAIVQVAAASAASKIFVIEIRAKNLPLNAAGAQTKFVSALVTADSTGTIAAISGVVLAGGVKDWPASQLNLAAVAQKVCV